MKYKTLLKSTLVICGALWLSACATTSSTTPKSFDQVGQFSSYPLNAQSYRISFKAPNNMGQATAEEITLLKSAQVTVQQGYQYFKVVNDPSSQVQPARTAVVYPQPFYYPYRSAYGYSPFYDDPFFNPPRVVQIEPVQISYHIELFKENNQPQDAFDARLILQHLGAKYGVSTTGQTITPKSAQ